jgi:hypothetical protein
VTRTAQDILRIKAAPFQLHAETVDVLPGQIASRPQGAQRAPLGDQNFSHQLLIRELGGGFAELASPGQCVRSP